MVQLCEDDPPELDVDPARHNECRDCLCIVIFGAFWFFLLCVFVFVWSYGDTGRLVYPSDYKDNLCGRAASDETDGAGQPLRSAGNLINHKVVTFPRLADDVESVMLGDTCDKLDDCTIELLSVCTDKCPKANDIVCTYEIDELGENETVRAARARVGTTYELNTGCWFTPIDTVAYFGRCIPWPEKLEIQSYKCMFEDQLHFQGPEMCYSHDGLNSTQASRDPCNTVMERNEWDTNKGCIPDDETDPLQGHTWLRDRCHVEANKNLCLAQDGCNYVGPFDTPPQGRRSGDCGSGKVVEVQKSTTTTTGGSDYLMAMLVSYTTMAQQVLADVLETLPLILLFGSLVSVLMGFCFLVLLWLFAPCIVWGIVLGVFCAIGLSDAYVSLKAGEFFTIDITHLSSTVQSEAEIISENTDPGQNLDVDEWFAVSDADNIVYWKIASYALFVLWILYTCLMVCGRDKIRLCVDIVEHSSEKIGQVFGIVLVPFVVYAMQLCCMVFFGFYIMMLKSVDSFTAADLKAAASDSCRECGAGNSACLQACIHASLNGHVTGVVKSADPAAAADAAQEDNLAYYMMWVALFGFLWTVNVFSGVGTIVMSRSVADTYWHDPTPPVGSSTPLHPLPLSPTLNALRGTLIFHVGSAIFGGLLIAIVQLVRAIIEYVDRQTKELQEHNTSMACVFKAVKCCAWCAEKVVQRLTKNSYILVAITGKAFMPSAIKAASLLIHNAARCAVVQSVSWLVLWLGKICITFGATFCFYTQITTDPAYLPPTVCEEGQDGGDDGLCGGESQISDPRLPCVCTAVMALCVASAFMDAYGITSDTLLLSLCLDEEYAADGLYGKGDDEKPLFWERANATDEDANKKAKDKLEKYRTTFDKDESSWCGGGAKAEEAAPAASDSGA